MEVKYKLNEGAFHPTKAYEWDVGFDLRTPYSFTVYPGGREDVDTGVCFEIPHGFFGLVASKSGLMVEDGSTTFGIIDSDYRGSIHGVIFNHSKHAVNFEVGDKVTQILILPAPYFDLKEVSELSQTKRGDKGFGSSGKK